MKRRKIMFGLILLTVVVILIVLLVRSPYFLNITFGISDYFRDRGLTTPSDVIRVDNRRYGDDPMQVFDVYYPKGTDHPLPTIVSIHGGGYTYGSKEVYQYYCMNLAQHGFTVVNYSYRLAPKHKFPSQLEDTNAVLTAICASAEEYPIDTENIFFVGDSAGGHLNAQYSAAVTNPAYAKLLSLEIPAFTLRATALNCGVYEMKDVTGSSMKYYLDGDPEKYTEQLDIMGHITSAFPPAFVMSSTGDMCLPFAVPMSDCLTKAGVENEVHIYGDDSTKPPHVFHINIRNKIAEQCNKDECDFFRERIG